jgi:hypothetical protein
VSFTPGRVRSAAAAGTLAGSVAVSDGSEHATVPVRTTASIKAVPLSWKLERS